MTDAEEKKGIEKTLKETDGNVRETAVRLKMRYRTLLRRIHDYGIAIGPRGRKKQRIVLPGEEAPLPIAPKLIAVPIEIEDASSAEDEL